MKTVSIHQAQYIPWPPYIKKIFQSDVFVIMDNVQFQKNGVQNRNRLRTKKEAFWLTIPVSGSMTDSILEKQIVDRRWPQKHWRSLQANYASAPYWDRYSQDLEYLYKQEYQSLFEVNLTFTLFILEHLDIDTEIVTLSSLSLNQKKSDLVLEACSVLGADVYLSGLGSKTYLNEDAFTKRGIEIRYLASTPPFYNQVCEPFIEGLSMLDMMFYVPPHEILAYLKE